MPIKNMGSAIMRFNEGIIVSGSKSSSFPNRVPLYVSGSITLDAEEPTIAFKEGTGDRVTIGVNDSDNLNVINQSVNKYIVFKTNDAGTVREGFRIGGPVPEVVVNEGSESLVDFRVESDDDTHMIYVDGGNNNLGIGTSTPGYKFHVSADAGETPNGISAYFRSADTDYSRIAVDATANADTQISFMNNGSTKWSIGNEASGDSFYVSSSFGAFGNAAPLIIDGSTGTTMVESLTVARNSSSPYAMLESHGPAMFNMGNSATSGELYVMSSSAHSPPVLAVLPASGSVGVGAYEPQNTLTVSGSVAFSSLFIGAQNNPGSSYYVSPKDHVLLINTNGTAMGGTNSALDVFLPTAAKYPGMVVSIKDAGGNFGTNNVVVKRTGTDYVGHFGSTSQTLSSNGEYAQFMSNGWDSWMLMFKVS